MNLNMKSFYGVVERIDDPEKMNRVQVRIFGQHSEQTVVDDSTGKGIPPEDLPWAFVMMPSTCASVHGFGANHGLVEGSWVLGTSLDGDGMNYLVVMGSLPTTVPEKKNPNPKSPPAAFWGQDGKWPDEEFLEEPDVSRLARGVLEYKNEKWKPIPKIKEEEQEKGIEEAGGGTWDQKNHEFKPKYPNNQVFSTHSGHTIELDNTEGSERITVFHGKSHTFIDILPDGSVQTKIEGDNFSIVKKDRKVLIKGDLSITVEGDAKLKVDGDVKADVKGDIEAKIDGNSKIESKGSIEVDSKTNINIKSVGELKIKSDTVLRLEGEVIKLKGRRI